MHLASEGLNVLILNSNFDKKHFSYTQKHHQNLCILELAGTLESTIIIKQIWKNSINSNRKINPYSSKLICFDVINSALYRLLSDDIYLGTISYNLQQIAPKQYQIG